MRLDAASAMIAIEGCHLGNHCTQRWEAMEPLRANPRVRYCERCQSAVHWVADVDEHNALARQGKCVAIPRTQDPAKLDAQMATDLAQ